MWAKYHDRNLRPRGFPPQPAEILFAEGGFLKVRALDTALALVEEALTMRSCLGAYSQPAFDNVFIFAVWYQPPAPATKVFRMTCALELERAADAKGQMRLTMTQCRLSNNRNPPSDVEKKVLLALERNVSRDEPWVHQVSPQF